MMKLQIVEYKESDKLNDCYRYRYTLELDERLILQFDSMDIRFSLDYVTKKLMASIRLLTDIDIDLEHYYRFNIGNIPNIVKTILFEQKVSDHYLKDIKIQQRINDLQRDFEK